MASTLATFESLGFYQWGHLKFSLYAAPVHNEEALYHRIVGVCQTICNFPGVCERKQWSTRVKECTESHGGHFQLLLQMHSFSCNSQIKCFQTYADMAAFSCFGMWNPCPNFVSTVQIYPVYI
jgi:hypothetical protein